MSFIQSLTDKFENRFVPLLSLSKLDSAWSTALNESLVFGIWSKIKAAFQSNTKLATLGNLFELFSFALVLLLFLVLPAPQFADDKQVLASVVLAATGLRVVGILLSKQAGYKPCAIDMLVLAFAGMNVIATASSYYPIQSLKGLSKMAVYFCSYFLFLSALQKSTAKRSLLTLLPLLGAALAVSAYGLYQYKMGVAPLATWVDPTVDDHSTRVFSTLKNPNLLAGYLVPLIPLSLSAALVFFLKDGWKKFLFVPVLGAAAVISVACVLTGSRGGWIGIAGGVGSLTLTLVYWLWMNKPKFRPVILIALLLSPLVLFGIIHKMPSLENRIMTMFVGRENSSNSYRMNVWISSFKLFCDNWWLGVGPGNSTFKLIYGIYMKSGFDALGTYCVPLEVAVETGVMGLLAFVAMIVSTMARAHEQFWQSINTAPERWIKAGAAAGLLGMMMHGLVDTVYYRPQVQLIFWLLLALCIAKDNGVVAADAGSASKAISAGDQGRQDESAA